MADRQKVSQLLGQTEYRTLSGQTVSQLLAQIEYRNTTNFLSVSQLFGQVEYQSETSGEEVYNVVAQVEFLDNSAVVRVTSIVAQVEFVYDDSEPPYDDGSSIGGLVYGGDSSPEVVSYNQTESVSSGGIVFGGLVTEVGSQPSVYTDGTTHGGIVFGGPGIEPVELHQVDGSSSGGITWGGEVTERWSMPWAVAVKGGTYRIAGLMYTLSETLYLEGLGTIAAIVQCGLPPSTTDTFRYDLLSIDTAGNITVTKGTEAYPPVMPSVPSNQIKLNHVLRYYGQTAITQTDIGANVSTPMFTTMVIDVADDELSWGESSTNITVYVYDQYGVAFTGGVVLSASIVTGKGDISPVTQSGGSSSFSFTYTREGTVGDISPFITFSSPEGQSASTFISLLDASGNVMI